MSKNPAACSGVDRKLHKKDGVGYKHCEKKDGVGYKHCEEFFFVAKRVGADQYSPESFDPPHSKTFFNIQFELSGISFNNSSNSNF